MSIKYKNKYRIKSTRFRNWDYGWNASYFVTICTYNREHYFGKIINSLMQLSEIGYLADKYWCEIPEHFPFVELGKFVIMPNHIHGIVVINKPNDGRFDVVETQNFTSLQSQITSKNKFGPQSKNLASIIRGYKIGVTKNAHKIPLNFKWKSRFYDHIIRNDKSYKSIAEYIKSNPKNWNEDKLNT